MLVTLENAAKAFAVPYATLYELLKEEPKSFHIFDRVIKAHLEDCAKVLGISTEDFRSFRAGREWFMSRDEIQRCYGEFYNNEPMKFKRIAGREVLHPVIGVPVYRASPFIKFAMMSEEKRAAFLEDKNVAVGSGLKTSREPIRKGLERPRKDDLASGPRRRKPKRLVTRRPTN